MDFQNIADMFLVNKNNHRPMAKGDAGIIVLWQRVMPAI